MNQFLCSDSFVMYCGLPGENRRQLAPEVRQHSWYEPSEPYASQLPTGSYPTRISGAAAPYENSTEIFHAKTISHMIEDSFVDHPLDRITKDFLASVTANHYVSTFVCSDEFEHHTIQLILEQVRLLLQADGASLLLFDAEGKENRFRCSSGICPVATEHCQDHARIMQVAPSFLYENMACVSLFTQDTTIGALCTCRAAPIDEADMHLLSSMGTILASTLLEQYCAYLQKQSACEHTLEGWVRALELRDQETREHSQRVTTMTVELARLVGLSEQDIVHIRRGALLHDIGKLAIPDDILLKPGPLTDDEWGIMREHPRYAQTLLSSIPFLQPALDIPVYHHEKWDGTGYPHALKAEEIPLAARIFAVVDVWDALSSDRPYRKAWLEKDIFRHIEGLAGIHFDPQVTPVFLEYMHTRARKAWKQSRVGPI